MNKLIPLKFDIGGIWTSKGGKVMIVSNIIRYGWKFANLIGKLNFYKLIPYPMDNSLSSRRGPARQTSEKDVLCLHRLGRPSAVHSPDGV